jgi:hypothetical protein
MTKTRSIQWMLALSSIGGLAHAQPTSTRTGYVCSVALLRSSQRSVLEVQYTKAPHCEGIRQGGPVYYCEVGAAFPTCATNVDRRYTSSDLTTLAAMLQRSGVAGNRVAHSYTTHCGHPTANMTCATTARVYAAP